MKQIKQIVQLALFLFQFSGGTAFAQTSSKMMNLQQCIQFGMSNNATLLKSQLEVQRTQEQRIQTRAGYLPQVNGSASLMNNLQLQTSIIPGEFFGQPGENIAVQFGTQYNVQLGIDASQTLYDQSLIYALKMNDQNTKLMGFSAKKTEEQLIYDIATAYYAAQVTFTQQNIVQSNLAQIDTLLNITRVQLENGFAKQLDLDRLLVNQTNLQTDLENSLLSYQQQLLLLKYYMGMPQETAIELPILTGNEQVSGILIDGESLSSTDMNILQAQQDLYAISLQQIKAGYLPTLVLNFHTGLQVQQNDLRIFAKDANWFPNSYVGLNLQIPIFDGLAKHSRVKQLNIQIQESELDKQYFLEGLKMQRANANNKLRMNKTALENQLRNIELAQNNYETTRVQYVAGIGSMAELVNAETSLKESQTNYLKALVQVKLAELELIKTTGNISSIN